MGDMKLYPQLDASDNDGIWLDVDKVGVLVLAGIYNDLIVRSESNSIDRWELRGFERALRLVGIDPDMLKGVDTSY